MAHETVPADIAAAITAYGLLNRSLIEAEMKDAPEAEIKKVHAAALHTRAALDAVILHHLRAADAMKAALERIEQGV